MKVHVITAVYIDGTIATVRTCSYIKLIKFKASLKKGVGKITKLTIDGKEEKLNG